MKILAVDDDPIFLDILALALREAGYSDVTLALSGHEALEELEEQTGTFDCILLDIQMPVMDGIELCRRIRRMARYQRTPIMMVTAMSARCYIDDAFAAGATDYLTKPLDAVEFRARMGMMDRLVYEQLRTTLLEHQMRATAGVVEMKYDFDQPVLIPGFDRGIEYLALQNYLLTLSSRESYFVSAFAINVRNASVIYGKATPLSFMNMLADVAALIDDALRAPNTLISYAGGGNFVVAVNGLAGLDLQALEEEINVGIETFDALYIADRLPLPQVCVGQPTRSSIFSRARAARMLERAIDSAQTRPLGHGRRSQIAA